MRHIGIVACSAEGAALCYQTICREGADILGRHAHPEITMHTYPLSEYLKHIYNGDWDGVAQLMIGSAEKVTAAGADFLICPDNTIHQAFNAACLGTRRPWIHIADAVINEAITLGYRSLGIMGTRYLMEGPVYREKLDAEGIHHTIPPERERERINHIIFDELTYGILTDDSRTFFSHVISSLKNDGCDAVVLGCTEIPLLVTPDVSPLPTLDSTRLLARTALRAAAGHAGMERLFQGSACPAPSASLPPKEK
jgi:aspartate racemase